MPSPSKEDSIKKLILENSPLKEWHFEEIVKESGTTRAVANKWLKKYVSEGLLKHRKEKGSFPFYTAGKDNPIYNSTKRFYALERLHRSGLIPALISLKNAKTIILFGSMAKGDWYKGSDIDIFILGDPSDFDKKTFEAKLDHDIEVHAFHDRAEIRKVRTGLIRNIIDGYVIKGSIKDIARIS